MYEQQLNPFLISLGSWLTAKHLEPDCLGLNPASTSYQQSDPGQVTRLLAPSFSCLDLGSFLIGVVGSLWDNRYDVLCLVPKT